MTAETVRTEILMNDSRGVYIPKHFGENFKDNLSIVNSKGEADAKLTELVNGLADQEPYGDDSEGYWDDWTRVLDTVHLLNPTTNEIWSLYQDGDLRLINTNDLAQLDNEEQEKFWENFCY